jgi:dihydrofolate reductase
MRKLIVQEFVSLDGLAAGPGGSVDFVPAATRGDRSFGREQMTFLESVDLILLGRVTYELFAGHWPNVNEGDDKPFADRLNSTPKVVFSQTLGRAPWGGWDEARIVKHNAADEVARLKRQSGRDMVLWGSISLAQHLMDRDLVDEYRLVMCPIILGGGRPLFREDGGPITMKLMSGRPMDRGAVSLTYVQDDRSAAPDRK